MDFYLQNHPNVLLYFLFSCVTLHICNTDIHRYYEAMKYLIGGYVRLRCRSSTDEVNWYYERSSSHPMSLPIAYGKKIKVHLNWDKQGLDFCTGTRRLGFTRFFAGMPLKLYSKS